MIGRLLCRLGVHAPVSNFTAGWWTCDRCGRYL